ncbi:hypothetical protein [Hymenobacter chitinivorans]|uniref:LTXXQ motif family protein n=1 Tax=Hymenobacter chitinivorans DSM 11115 TaxID=1121954 RepID=A0A2M9B5T1_9BACT|nr:hypothetical protein [Hymenobacter chitinivorans]PJJ53292.1 hypothetical protein CLV45_3952 [Hymenobacter chitinivorans DSM 11115]
MLLSRSLLVIGALSTVTFGCARRHKADIPEAKSVPVAPAPVPKAAARDLTDVMTDELKLLPDQQGKVRAILSGTVEKVNDARQRNAGNQTALMAELKKINADSEGQLKAVLTAVQYKQYQSKKRQMQAQMQARRTAK